jgi:uncharacterized membrane protein YhfC
MIICKFRVTLFVLHFQKMSIIIDCQAGHTNTGRVESLKMDILFFSHLLNALLMIAMPVALAIYLTRKFHFNWWLWFIGGATFILSQVLHIPFNSLVSPYFQNLPFLYLPTTWQIVLQAIFLGLSAGLFEELFRYGMFRWWAKDARSWRRGVLAGAGHGGAEAIILGGLALYGFFQLSALRNVDLSTIFPPDQLGLAQSQVTSYWSMNWPVSLFGALERFFTIPIQISLAVIVLQAFTRKRWYWVALAVLYHALVDTGSVIASSYLGLWTEAIVGLFAVISIWIIFALRQPEPAELVEQSSSASLPSYTPPQVEETPEKLDNTRYQGDS